jgi:hypothetical protein
MPLAAGGLGSSGGGGGGGGDGTVIVQFAAASAEPAPFDTLTVNVWLPAARPWYDFGLEHGENPPLSRRQLTDVASFDVHAMVAVVSCVSAGGFEVIVTVGADGAGVGSAGGVGDGDGDGDGEGDGDGDGDGGAFTVHEIVSASVPVSLPTRTTSEWVPTGTPLHVSGLEQDVHCPESRRHSVVLAFCDVQANVATVSVVVVLGRDVTVSVGAGGGAGSAIFHWRATTW